MKKQQDLPTYESAFAELQQIVRELQEEAAGIDTLTEKIARATELIRFCRERLRMTEEEIGKLTDLSD
ncbi:MAG: exodeoxyribonuclease VII small subunit [Lewinellaceae bacterium]|nr:exodeoxyribonuclease VII small subunit [Lewinellaceae bacterium]MCB9356411.1 exodeoxyribonuclease VII small subunit [Lewinellaceae bacterium]